MSRPIRARLDWSALRHNHGVVRRHSGGARIWSVLKADAYGHGLLSAARALIDSTDGFALVELEGAVALRDAGFAQPILMLEGPYQADELPLYAEVELTPVLHTMWQVDALVEARLPIRPPVYLKLNTGMNRLGFNEDEFAAALDKLVAADCIGPTTLMTHFADADEARGIGRQLRRFRAMADSRQLPISLANSAALLRFPEAIGDLGSAGHHALWRLAHARHVQRGRSRPETGDDPEQRNHRRARLSPGERVGYGGTFEAPGQGHAYRRRRLRLCRRLSAPCPDRHAHSGRRAPHAHPGPGLDGHAGLRFDPPGGGRRRLARSRCGGRG
jgi:alanine racemase